ncbi:translation protein, partial [Phakopsora pachyrhizi]
MTYIQRFLCSTGNQISRIPARLSILTTRSFATAVSPTSESTTAPSCTDDKQQLSPPSPSPSPSSSSLVIQPPQQPWAPGIRRMGVLGRKRGMTSFWDSDGTRVPVTVIELEDAQVVGHKYEERDSYYAVQVGCSNRYTRRIHNAQKKWFQSAKLTPKQKVSEFKVTDERSLVPIGTDISAAHFVPGQFVDVKSTSKGKGFAGVMKRWGFSGGNASHGSTKHHRKAGSTGQHQDPGRVWPGKKMAGRMGNKKVTVRNLLVARIDTHLNLLYIRGQVPGPKKTFVRVTDAEKGVHRIGTNWMRKGWDHQNDAVLPGKIKILPFPTIDKTSAIKNLPDQISFVGKSQL